MEPTKNPQPMFNGTGYAVMKRLGVALCAAIMLGGVPQASADDSVVRLTSPDGGPYEIFGASVQIEGDVAVIGEPEWGEAVPAGPGAAYVYRFDTDELEWELEAQLHGFGAHEGDFFGDTVALDGNVLAISAFRSHWPGAGRVCVFRYDEDTSTWVEEQEIAGPNEGEDYDFGVYMTANCEVICVTATLDYWEPPYACQYMYRYNDQSGQWDYEQQIVPEDDDCDYGQPSVDGDRMVIGYDDESDLGPFAGTALVFEYDHDTGSWAQTARLNASDAPTHNHFGCSVALAGDLVAIGANDRVEPDTPGAVYIFKHIRGSWVEVAMIVPDDAETGDRFGNAVDFDGETLVATAPGGWGDPGAAYVYDFDPDTYEWSLRTKLLPKSEYEDCFGHSVALSDSRVIVGDHFDNELGYDAGAAYFFELAGSDCPADFDCDGDVDTADLLHLLGAWGTPDGDVDGDGDTDTADLLALLAAWGECPD